MIAENYPTKIPAGKQIRKAQLKHDFHLVSQKNHITIVSRRDIGFPAISFSFLCSLCADHAYKHNFSQIHRFKDR